MNKDYRQEIIKTLLCILHQEFPKKKGNGHIRIRVRQDGSIGYQFIAEVWRLGKRYRKAKTFDKKEDAINWGKEFTEMVKKDGS